MRNLDLPPSASPGLFGRRECTLGAGNEAQDGFIHNHVRIRSHCVVACNRAALLAARVDNHDETRGGLQSRPIRSVLVINQCVGNRGAQ